MRHPSPPDTLLIDRIPSPIGTMLAVHDPAARLHALDFEDCEPRLRALLRLHHGDCTLHDCPVPAAIRLPIADYFDGDLGALDQIEVVTAGTPFQRDVWAALRTIRAGTTMSYSALACHLGRPRAVRAVGMANGANPIAVVLPCHRVIGADASLTGYGGGLERKRWLLMHERAAFKELATPARRSLTSGLPGAANAPQRVR